MLFFAESFFLFQLNYRNQLYNNPFLMRNSYSFLLFFLFIFSINLALALDAQDQSTTQNSTQFALTQQSKYANKQISQDQIKCNAKCRNNALCFQICQNGIGTTQIIIIIGSILSFILLLVCLGVICNFGFLMHLPCHHFQRLKKNLNVVNAGEMQPKNFEQIVERIVENINYSKNGNYTNGDNMKVQAHAAIERNSQFLVELKITGKDFKDRWRGVGFVVCRNQGQVFFWMYKMYNSKLANKGGLVLETSKRVEEDGSIEGVWSYIENENQKGQWKLESKQSKSNPLSSQIISPLFPSTLKLNLYSSTQAIKGQQLNSP